jgi:hypothetical protein
VKINEHEGLFDEDVDLFLWWGGDVRDWFGVRLGCECSERHAVVSERAAPLKSRMYCSYSMLYVRMHNHPVCRHACKLRIMEGGRQSQSVGGDV